MNKVEKSFKHLCNITKHKWYVFKYAVLCGIPWRGLVHDLSKFSPVEFCESVKFFEGDKTSPIIHAVEKQGYSLAWLHHKGRNPHHHEYWLRSLDSPDGPVPVRIQRKYLLEMLCDFLSANKLYGNGTFESAKDFWDKRKEKITIHPESKEFLDECFRTLTFWEEHHMSIREAFYNIRQTEY